MRNSTVVGRVAAMAAVLIAIIAVAAIVLSSGPTYKVQAMFLTASQIVSGDQVEVAGNSVGTVSGIALTPDGQARLTLQITDPNYQPLRQGTTAVIRQTSLSGIANRYVDLRLGPGGAASIKNGDTIGTANTTSEVDLDQLFNTLDQPTRKGLQNFIQGSASQYAGSAPQAARAFQYLNPAIVSSSVLFREINRDTGRFTNFIVKSGDLVTTLAQRSSDLTGLIQHLSTTTQALAAQRTALGQSIQRLPGFMRLANTTFVNLRSALDDLTPLVNVSKPVAPKLQTLLVQLKPLAEQSVPTVRDLANIISRPGADNDLTDLIRLGVPLANATVRNVYANGRTRLGAFPQSTLSLNQSTPELAVARPYAVDLTSWFEGFSHPGTIDVNGGTSRIGAVLNLPSLLDTSLLPGVPLGQQVSALFSKLLSGGSPLASVTTGYGDRCPGSIERGSVWYPQSGFPCNPSQVPRQP